MAQFPSSKFAVCVEQDADTEELISLPPLQKLVMQFTTITASWMIICIYLCIEALKYVKTRTNFFIV